MPNYTESKIYKIEPVIEHDIEDVYFGSTTKKYLSDRMRNHKNLFRLFNEGKGNYTSSFELFRKYGVENCKIFLLESVNANDKNELNTREGFYIQNNACVNKCIAGRGKKQYVIDNKDKIAEIRKKFHIDNRENLLMKAKIYRDTHTDIVNCPCGSTIKKIKFSTHIKSQKHQNYLLNDISMVV